MSSPDAGADPVIPPKLSFSPTVAANFDAASWACSTIVGLAGSAMMSRYLVCFCGSVRLSMQQR